MDEVFKEPVQFAKGVNLRDLLTSEAEFQIDVDFKQRKRVQSLIRNDLMEELEEDDEDSDSEEVVKNLEQSVSDLMLSSPEYLSFKDLATHMTDCLPNGDAKILILEEGNGPLVPVDAEVLIHYAAYWEKGNIPFDSTLTMNRGAPLRLRLGVRNILVGLELGLITVRGPKARFLLLLQPSVTWGERGVPPRILPRTSLFVVALYSVRDIHTVARFNDLPKEEQMKFEVTMKTVKSLHTEAKDLYARNKYMKAIKNYQHSMTVLNMSRPQNETEIAEVKQLKITAYINLAVCYYKVNKPKYVISMCENLDLITDVNKNCKALFYLGKANEMLGKSDVASAYYKKALKLEPKNKDIGKTLANLDEYVKKSAKKEKEMWQNAFKSSPVKETIAYNVDEDFQNGVRDMCQDLAGRDEYVKFDLPPGLTKDEMACLKSLVGGFENLMIQEDGLGKKKKVSIIKK